MRWVHLNGRLLPEDQAAISPFDRGLTLGDAVFETMRAYGGRAHALDAHLARLRASCDATRIPFPDDLRARVADTLGASELDEAAVRITLTRGPGGRGSSPRGAGPSTVLVTVAPVTHAAEVYERGMRLVTSRARKPTGLPSSVKTTNYLAHVLARLEADDAGADEALFFDDDEQLVEATQANVFAIFGARLVTPPLSSGCLPGQTRAELLALGPSAGLAPVEAALAREDLLLADEVLLTASLLEVAPAVELDGVMLGGGKPGPRAAELRRLYRAHAATHG